MAPLLARSDITPRNSHCRRRRASCILIVLGGKHAAGGSFARLRVERAGGSRSRRRMACPRPVGPGASRRARRAGRRRRHGGGGRSRRPCDPSPRRHVCSGGESREGDRAPEGQGPRRVLRARGAPRPRRNRGRVGGAAARGRAHDEGHGSGSHAGALCPRGAEVLPRVPVRSEGGGQRSGRDQAAGAGSCAADSRPRERLRACRGDGRSRREDQRLGREAPVRGARQPAAGAVDRQVLTQAAGERHPGDRRHARHDRREREARAALLAASPSRVDVPAPGRSTPHPPTVRAGGVRLEGAHGEARVAQEAERVRAPSPRAGPGRRAARLASPPRPPRAPGRCAPA